MSLLNPQLEAFMQVAESKTVHAAAGVLHISQTGVTQRIRALEERLSTTLFVRTRRGMLLTEEGESLLRYCFAVRDLTGALMANLAGTAEAAIKVRIIGPASLMNSRVIPCCCQLSASYPGIMWQFDVDDQQDLTQPLKAGEAQFVLLADHQLSAEFSSKPLAAEQYVLVASSNWAKRNLHDIIKSEVIIDYDPSDQMTFNYLQHYQLLNLAKRSRHFVNQPESLAKMISQGIGYGVLTKEYAEPYLQSQELCLLNDGQIYKNPMNLAWFKRPSSPDYFNAIIERIN